MPLGSFAPAFHRSAPGAVSLGLLLFALSITTCAEPTDYVDRSVQARHTTTVAFLNQKLWLWQQRLRLQDWNVTVRLARATDLRPKTLGNINWDRKERTAVISIMDPDDYKLRGAQMLDDMEMTIVHELVHLHLSGLPRNDDTKKVEEQAVNMLAEALVKLDRKQFQASAPAPADEPPTQRARQDGGSQ
jgi:hypothetical protein